MEPAQLVSGEARLAFVDDGPDRRAVRRVGPRIPVADQIEGGKDLVSRTESTMAALAERLGIAMSPVLLTPTFNGRPIRANSSYAVEVQRKHPGRFAIIKPVDPADPEVVEVIAEWKKQPGAVAVRIMLTAREAGLRFDDPGIDRIAREAARHGFPVNVLFWGRLDDGMALIDRHPNTRFIVDHMGIMQPRTPPAPANPWADLPKVLELAKRPNALIKVSGACTLSHKPASLCSMTSA